MGKDFLMLVHAICGGQLFVHDGFMYCDICFRVVTRDEVAIITPRPQAKIEVR